MEGMTRIRDHSVDLILTDLPYGITDCKWDRLLPFRPLTDHFNRIVKDNGAIILTATQPFATDLINANRRYFRYDIVWEKTMPVGFANSHRMPLRAHELLLVFYRHLPTYNPQGLVRREKVMRKGKRESHDRESVYHMTTLEKPYRSEYTNYPRSVVRYSNSNHGSVHPTQKPLKLFEYLVRPYTNESDTVMDCCMGSVTTGAACVRSGRSFLGFESDTHYYSIACERIRGEQPQAAPE